jgi:hypothetical protein
MENTGALVVDRAEQIKWWNAIDAFKKRRNGDRKIRKGLKIARSCRHPDSMWLASLFPAGVAVTEQRVAQVMLEQGSDRRALFFAGMLGSTALLQRSAEMGYAPAQAQMAARCKDELCFEWARRAAEQMDRGGLHMLGLCYRNGCGCVEDKDKWLALCAQAAELEHPRAQWVHSRVAFGRLDWQRYHWWGRALANGYTDYSFGEDVLTLLDLLPSFEKGEHGRLLHAVAPLVRAAVNVATTAVPRVPVSDTARAKINRLFVLNEAMLRRARRAIACWSMAGRQCGVVKDVRVVVAKMAWEDVWRWGEIAK